MGLVMAAAACMMSATADQLTRRASFDLGCVTSELRYTKIDALTQGVTGCGRRATYVESCRPGYNNMPGPCTWVLNGAVESTEPPPSTATTVAPDLSGPPEKPQPPREAP
jgi:hypothetical protein